MTRPYVRKCRPQRHEQSCDACDGAGSVLAEDFDELGSHRVMVICDACDGQGRVCDCDECDEPTSVIVLELNGGLCGTCAAERELAS